MDPTPSVGPPDKPDHSYEINDPSASRRSIRSPGRPAGDPRETAEVEISPIPDDYEPL